MPNQAASEKPFTKTRRAGAWWWAISTILAALWALYQDSGDPFGIDTFLETLSANSYTAITSPFYGKDSSVLLEGKSYRSRLGQSQIIVLLIDDHYLDTTDQTWPIAPDKYKRTLRKLAQADAAAVFLDIYFAPGNDRKAAQVSALFRAARDIEERSETRFFFASTLRDPDLSSYNKAPAQAAIAQTVSPLNIYPLSQTGNKNVVVDTAGWALYKAWCNRKVNQANCPDDIQKREVGNDMYLLWGFAPNEIMTQLPEFNGADCIKQSQSLSSKIAASLNIFGTLATKGYQPEGLRDSSGSVRNAMAPCPYHTQMNLTVFNHLRLAELTELFQHKIVVIGTSLKIFTEYQFSPVHGYVSGAFWHATAADNLIEFGDGYLREAGEYGDAEKIGIVFLILINSLLSLLIIQIDRRECNNADKIESLHIAHGVFVFCAISAIVLWFVWHDRVSPANWIGLALLMMMIAGNSLVAMWHRFSDMAPIPMSNPILYETINGLKGALVCGAVLIICYISFLLPQGLFLSRVGYADTLCWTILAGYGGIGAFCFITIARNWFDFSDVEMTAGDTNAEGNSKYTQR